MDSKTTVKQEESIYLISNPYFRTINKSRPSKTRLKKCEKGLHEYMSEGKIKIDEHFYKEKWSCIHCGALMQNR